MSRSDLVKHRLPTEYEDEVIALLETYGKPADIAALAELMGVSGYGLKAFIQSKRGLEAIARAHPDAKKLLRPHIRLPSPTQDPALLEEASLNGMHTIIESEIPEGLASSFRLHKTAKKKRHAA